MSFTTDTLNPKIKNMWMMMVQASDQDLNVQRNSEAH